MATSNKRWRGRRAWHWAGFNPRNLTFFTLVAAIVCAGGVLAASASTTGPSTRAAAASGKPTAPVSDPQTSLPDSARMSANADEFANAMKRRALWIENFQASGQDVASLPRAERAVVEVPGANSLINAVRKADLIIEAKVSSLTFTPQGTVATMSVSNTFKPVGTSGLLATVNVLIPGGPEPAADGSGMLAFDPGVPYLFPGDRAFLLLQTDQVAIGSTQDRATYHVQSVSGEYAISPGGTIHATADNSFGAEFAGASITEFRSELSRAIASS